MRYAEIDDITVGPFGARFVAGNLPTGNRLQRSIRPHVWISTPTRGVLVTVDHHERTRLGLQSLPHVPYP